MIILYILLGIVLFIALLFSLHLKFYLKIDGTTTIHAGLGPIVLKLLPKKDAKAIDLRNFTYEKHQKRLEHDRKAALKKAEKKAKKTKKKKRKRLCPKKLQRLPKIFRMRLRKKSSCR